MALDKIIKSSRLLASRRYTHDSFTDAQEAFTQTIEIGAGEIFTDVGALPSASLPFSGSTQNGSIYQSGSINLAKYWFRHKLTRSDTVSGSKSEVWLFLNPTGSDSGVGAQLIQTTQQTNFISPKYSDSTLANANTEDGTPGYKVKVFVSSNASTPADGDVISDNSFVFDYKTGVLQFTTNATAATTSQYVYVSAYQYVGRTLQSQLGDGSISGTTTWDSIVGKPPGIVSSSAQITSSLGGTGIVSSSAQLLGSLSGSSIVSSSAQTLTNLIGSSVISSSAQVTSNLPTGVMSGSAQTVANLFGQNLTVATLTAETYILSSSVIYITTSFSSGSTQFGDTLDDTHLFSGSLFLMSSQSLYSTGSGANAEFIMFVNSGSGAVTYKNTIDGGSF